VYTLMREIELKPSRLLGMLLLGMAALALTAVCSSALPGAVQLALSAALIGVIGWNWQQDLHSEALRLTAAGRLQSMDEQGEWGDVEVLGDSLVTPALIVLRYQPPDGHVRSLTLLPDSTTPDNLRRLRVSLRWARHTRSDTANPDVG
jgi:toxin CptA